MKAWRIEAMSHQPIQFGEGHAGEHAGGTWDPSLRPVGVDLVKDRALTVTWSDGRVSVYPVVYLRKQSPSAEAQAMREAQSGNPLNVLPASVAASLGKPLVAEGAELVGNYALRVRFSDGHDSGIYSWRYLREIDPG
jgi:DUF971 family protein